MATGTSNDSRPAVSLREQLREDRAVHYGSWLHPGFQVLAVHRFGRWSLERGGLVGRVGLIAFKAVNNIVIRNVYGTEISVDARIGRRVLIGHHQAVMIPRYCVVGDDTIIRHGVTIGYARTNAPPADVPRIGARVDIAPGVHLIGPIAIGDDTRIGPGSIVTTDVPAGSTVFAAPARIMRPPASPASPASPAPGR
ncbi:transferase [Frankia sp. R43]|uniref:serine O-acetyltransferase n=1 Tax=Frankia sp. R43 TaxID=269536 RepID=UPI0006CA531C|nr:serine acetyltransferase [Frankia sp. R43]KPM53831.1 transferase [Frankia sp. R43]